MSPSPGSEEVLTVRNLKVTYQVRGGEVRALRGVDLTVRAGESVGILGESGAGKTTIAAALLGLLPRNALVEGSARFVGRDLLSIPGDDLHQIRGVGISGIFQDPASTLSPFLRVRDQLADVYRSHDTSCRDNSASQVRRCLEQVGLVESRIGDAYPHELSGGQLQRVSIARAIICSPRLLIGDEPLSSLDTLTQAGVLSLFQTLRLNLAAAFLMISHDPGVLSELSSSLIVMYAGRIIESGPTASVLRDPLHPYTNALLRCAVVNERGRFSVIEGEAPDAELERAGCAFEPRCPSRMVSCRSRVPESYKVAESRQVSCLLYES